MRRKSAAPILWWLGVLAVVAVPFVATLKTQTALAQSWNWPWETETRRPPPREQPRYEPDNRPPPAYQGQQGPPPGTNRASICLQLEQQLARQANGGDNRAQQIAELNQQIRDTRRKLRRSEIAIDRNDCYETFLFSRTLRRSRQCVDLAQSVSKLQSQLQTLELQQNQARAGSPRSRQDEIIRELAANDCGDAYVQEARRRSPTRSFWQDQDTPDERIRGNTFSGLPFATYRTLCVRLCDGYYFPVSFSTLPTHFSRDADACQSRCAAPTELYFHQNPGGSVAEMVSQMSQKPYKSLSTAFRYRKEYVPGCSCKQAEYVPQDGTTFGRRKAELDQSPTKAPNTSKRDAMSPVR